jgi:hypothetical protein
LTGVPKTAFSWVDRRYLYYFQPALKRRIGVVLGANDGLPLVEEEIYLLLSVSFEKKKRMILRLSKTRSSINESKTRHVE